MAETESVVCNDMQIKINMLVAELEHTKYFISAAIKKSPNDASLFYAGMSIINRIDQLSKWKEQ